MMGETGQASVANAWKHAVCRSDAHPKFQSENEAIFAGGVNFRTLED